MSKIFGEDLDREYAKNRGDPNVDFSHKDDIFRRVRWEEKLNQDIGEANKYWYNEHESRLRKEGWSRSPSPQEVMSLIIANMEGRLDEYYKDLVQSILDGASEYYSTAVRVEKDNLFVYEEVTGIVYHKEAELYEVKGNSWYQRELIFNIKGLDHDEFYYFGELEKKHEDLIEYFYTRNVKNLPEGFIEGFEPGIYIPQKGLWPLNKPENTNPCDIDVAVNAIDSRGVKEK